MIGKALALVAGLGGGVSLSQFPELSQQYIQRLGGRVDALSEVVADFDRSAAAAGMTQETALADMRGTSFMEMRADDMRRAIRRHERLSEDLHVLRGSTELGRLAHVIRFRDSELLSTTWGDFRPAVPVTSAGLICAGLGFVLAWALWALLMGLLRLGWRRCTDP